MISLTTDYKTQELVMGLLRPACDLGSHFRPSKGKNRDLIGRCAQEGVRGISDLEIANLALAASEEKKLRDSWWTVTNEESEGEGANEESSEEEGSVEEKNSETGGVKKHKTVAEKVKSATVSRDRTGEAMISEEEIADIIRKRKDTEGQRITADRLAKMDIGDGNLTEEEKEFIAMTLRGCDKAIAFDDSERGRIDPRYAKPAQIHTVPHVPWKDRPQWKYAQKEKEEIVAFIKEKIRTFVAEPCESAYSNKWFFLWKGDSNKLRWIQNLQRTNAVTVRDVGSIPEADLLAEGSAGRSIYSICDLFSRYDEIPLDYRDRHMTDMHAPLGLVQMMVVPMGWTNGVAVFQRAMIAVLKEFIPEKVEVFLDDFPIKGSVERDETEVFPGVRKFVADHMKDVRDVLEKLDDANLTDFSLTDPTIARWMIHIRLYDYRVERISGTKNQVADGLSRFPIREEDLPRLKEEEETMAEETIMKVAANRTLVAGNSHEEGGLRTFFANLYDGKYRDIGLYLAGRGTGTERVQQEALGYCLRGGHLFKRPTKFAISMRVLCDPEEKKVVIEELHDGVVGGHRGVKGTLDKVRRLYWWDEQ
ncbi:hypothetical protein CBR_g6608 [Chara braunii]|uniref:Uncharacterized protein n=1 Tax=Chara braunii TaxID=69332 RepID=A0A388KKB5_CHABU|nr:hypothetical protein CBR_g6608 [Chara braunii]|eukprot:GBG70479.1 hypothetical protein CBR_g6608 [Chara braunii]